MNLNIFLSLYFAKKFSVFQFTESKMFQKEGKPVKFESLESDSQYNFSIDEVDSNSSDDDDDMLYESVDDADLLFNLVRIFFFFF